MKQNSIWWIKIIACSWLISIVSIIITFSRIASKTTQTGILRGRGLIIVDDRNKQRVKIVANRERCSLTCYDSNGNEKIKFFVSDQKSIFYIRQTKMELRIGAVTSGVILALSDIQGNLRIILGIDNKGIATLNFIDPGDIDRFVVYSAPKEVTPNKQSPGAILIFDTKGRLRVGIGVLPDGKPDIRLLDEKGKIVFKAP